jgi:hypothetical protein
MGAGELELGVPPEVALRRAAAALSVAVAAQRQWYANRGGSTRRIDKVTSSRTNSEARPPRVLRVNWGLG